MLHCQQKNAYPVSESAFCIFANLVLRPILKKIQFLISPNRKRQRIPDWKFHLCGGSAVRWKAVFLSKQKFTNSGV